MKRLLPTLLALLILPGCINPAAPTYEAKSGSAVGSAVAPAFAGRPIRLRIEGLDGPEVRNFEAQGFHWEVAQDAAGESRHGGSSYLKPPNVKDAVVTRRADSLSPALLQACLTHKTLAKVTIGFYPHPGADLPETEYVLSGVTVVRFTPKSDPAGQLVEEIAFDFDHVTLVARQGDGAPTTVGWDLYTDTASPSTAP